MNSSRYPEMLLFELFNFHILFEARLDFLRQKFVPLIAAAIENQTVSIPEPLGHLVDATAEITAPKVFDHVMACDPDPQKRNLQWLLTRLLKGEFLLEDGSKAFDYLKLFAQVKAQLPVDARDINRIKTLGDLYTLIEPFKALVSQRQMEKGVDEQMHEQAKVLLNTADYKVLIPLNKEASCYFGRNTQWCTAATRSQNYFEHYNNSGPLYIILDKKNNTRWQFQPATNSFMDEGDRPINLPLFCEQHPVIAQLFVQMDGKAVASIKTIPHGILRVYPDGAGGFQLKQYPGLASKAAVRINVQNGMLSDVQFIAGHDLLLSQPNVADLLNELQIKGDPKGMATENQCNLYYRDGFWGSLYEHAKPSLRLANGWLWSELKCEAPLVFTTYVLISPKPLKYPNSHAQRGGDHAYATAAIHEDGSFSVNNVLGTGKIQQRPVVLLPISHAVLSLILDHSTEIAKWERDMFNPSDLSEADGEVLLKQRPDLCDIGVLFKVQGLTDMVKAKINEAFEEAGLDSADQWTEDKLIIATWSDIEKCVEDIGNDHAKWLAKVVNGDERIEYYDHEKIDRDQLKKFLNDLTPEEMMKLAAWLKENYHDAIEAYQEENDEDEIDLTNMGEVAQLVLEQEIDEIKGAANSALLTGMEIGAENDAAKNYKSSIADTDLLFKSPDGSWSDKLVWDVEVGLPVAVQKLVDMIVAQELEEVRYNNWAGYLEVKVEASEPYNGYNDFDNEAAKERFVEEMPF